MVGRRIEGRHSECADTRLLYRLVSRNTRIRSNPFQTWRLLRAISESNNMQLYLEGHNLSWFRSPDLPSQVCELESSKALKSLRFQPCSKTSASPVDRAVFPAWHQSASVTSAPKRVKRWGAFSPTYTSDAARSSAASPGAQGLRTNIPAPQ
ncbi:hypothetical protein AOLI_G00293560 [Acnodon oligacanthus]